MWLHFHTKLSESDVNGTNCNWNYHVRKIVSEKQGKEIYFYRIGTRFWSTSVLTRVNWKNWKQFHQCQWRNTFTWEKSNCKTILAEHMFCEGSWVLLVMVGKVTVTLLPKVKYDTVHEKASLPNHSESPIISGSCGHFGSDAIISHGSAYVVLCSPHLCRNCLRGKLPLMFVQSLSPLRCVTDRPKPQSTLQSKINGYASCVSLFMCM